MVGFGFFWREGAGSNNSVSTSFKNIIHTPFSEKSNSGSGEVKSDLFKH